MLSFGRERAIIFGGTGTLGREIARRLAKDTDVTIFSRDECKQQAMRREFPQFRYVIGDVRDADSISREISKRDYDVAFHVAAMKHVDVCEANPIEAVATNIQGTINVAEACTDYAVPNCVLSSTDKAVDPINIYGMTKAIGERYFVGQKDPATNFTVFRWGNVLGSRGSVVHTFAAAMKRGHPIPITHFEMTRFWLHIDDACDFMLNNYSNQYSTVQYPEMKAAPVVSLAQAVADHLGIKEVATTRIGIRKGEKIHECMDREKMLYSDRAPQYTPDELREMVARVLD